VGLYLHSQYAFMAWCLVKHRDNFTLRLPSLQYSCSLQEFQIEIFSTVKQEPSYCVDVATVESSGGGTEMYHCFLLSEVTTQTQI